MAEKGTACVVGAGPLGLAALKCLREEGFDATAFDVRDDVGGVWNWSEEAGLTTCLKSTSLQGSRYISHFSDFPFPDDYSLYPTSSQMFRYFQSYAKHFGLYPHIRFRTEVLETRRDEEASKWLVTMKSKRDGTTSTRAFDKVVVALGYNRTPKMPSFPGQEGFAGTILHSQDYRSSKPFAGKNVVVLGIGNTAAEIAADLAIDNKTNNNNGDVSSSPSPDPSKPEKVYLSHRRGACVISRYRAGPPPEFKVSWHLLRALRWFETHFVRLYGWVVDLEMHRNRDQSWELDPAWGLSPPPPMTTVIPCVNEDLVALLAQDRVRSVGGLKGFAGPRSVELLDGTVLPDIDAVVMATGYDLDTSIMPWLGTAAPATPYAGRPQPDLYMQMFPPQYADSFACLNVFQALDTIWVLGELASMAVAQLWTGGASFPSPGAMRKSIADQAEFNAMLWRLDPSHETGVVKPIDWFDFIHDKAGTGLRDALGWGLTGWTFWRRERAICRLAGWGLYSPYLNRLLETGKRKSWAGAREALKKSNAEAGELAAPIRTLTLADARAGRL